MLWTGACCRTLDLVTDSGSFRLAVAARAVESQKIERRCALVKVSCCSCTYKGQFIDSALLVVVLPSHIVLF